MLQKFNKSRRTLGAALATAFATVVAGIGTASATGPGAAMLTQLQGLDGDVKAIIGVLALVVIALTAWAYLKRTR